MNFQYSDELQKVYLLILSLKKKIISIFIIMLLGSLVSYPIAEFIVKDITQRNLPYNNSPNTIDLLEAKILLNIEEIPFQTISNNLDTGFKVLIQNYSIEFIQTSSFSICNHIQQDTNLYFQNFKLFTKNLISLFTKSLQNNLNLNYGIVNNACILSCKDISIIHTKNKDYSSITNFNDTLIIHRLLVYSYYMNSLNIKEKSNSSINEPTIVYTKPLEVTLLNLKLSVLFGFLLSFPYLLYLIIKETGKIFIHFAFPLMLNKFVFIYSIIFFTVFIFGISVGYFLIAPFFIHFLYRNSLYLGAQATYSIYPFVSFILIICITFGFLFEFPIILFLMTKLNLVQLNTLKHFRRHLYVLFFIISGIITPPDVFTQLIVAIPMIIFYELSLLFIKIYQSMSI